MTPLTREWLEKADIDVASYERLASAPDPPHDSICFHAQQAAEKCLKAVLQERGISVERTHDLLAIVHAIQPPESRLLTIDAELKHLSNLAVHTRYPGFWATDAHANSAIQIAKLVREITRNLLGLKDESSR